MKCNAYLEKRCNSCSLLNMSYEETLNKKELSFFNLFDRNLIKNYVSPVSVNAEQSRNKAKLSVQSINGEIQFGIIGNELNFKRLEDCPLHLEGINQLLEELRPLLVQFKIVPYDLNQKKGELKNIIITKSDSTHEIMLRFVLRSKESVDRLKQLSIEIIKMNPAITVVSANIQPEHKAILEGDEEIVFTSKTYINHHYQNINLHLGVKSFFQVTSEVARKLYGKVENILAENKIQSFLDLYCGVGAFSFYAAKVVKNGLGVEISEEAIKFAQMTKAESGFQHLEFKSLDVDHFMETCHHNYDAVLVNPPRRGVGQKSMQKIANLAPNLIIYSSCNAETLARDFQIIKENYSIESAQIYDMFPFTDHFEVLMVFKKK